MLVVEMLVKVNTMTIDYRRHTSENNDSYMRFALCIEIRIGLVTMLIFFSLIWGSPAEYFLNTQKNKNASKE